MSNFLFSINVTIPIFLVMVIGYFLRRIGMLNENFVTVANKFNFKVTLPFLLFRDLSSVNIQEVFDYLFLECVWPDKNFYERQIYGRCFYSGFLPQQRGGYGTGIYPEYLRAVNNGIPDDHRCGSFVQHIFRACTDI